MTSQEILQRYLSFFKTHGHLETPNVSLVPEGDSTLLFVNSGMFPLVPYLSGEPHPLGRRLVNVQRSMRLDDLDEVGDYNHTTAFHMMGNWSLGDYFKKEQLVWIYEFFIDEIGLDPRRIFSSVFQGDDDAPRDDESIAVLKSIFLKHGIEACEGERIFLYDKGENWWKRGDAVGELGGPDSEIFYYVGQEDPSGISQVGRSPAKYDSEFLEIGNSVFMQFAKTENGWKELPQKNVDFGGGLERIALASQNKRDIFETDNFWPLIEKIQTLSGRQYSSDQETTVSMRILADHIRAASFLAMDGVLPSNKDQGYVLRRLLRRMVRYARKLGITQNISVDLLEVVAKMFEWLYPQLTDNFDAIKDIFNHEEGKFLETINRGARQVGKRLEGFRGDERFLAKEAFDLYQSLGYPPEMFFDHAQNQGVFTREMSFETYMACYQDEEQQHQSKSKTGADQKFKGGLADHSQEVVRYHTATHLLNYALREVLGGHIVQSGSNITGERLRFDFTHTLPLSAEEIVRIESIVNTKIREGHPVGFEMMPKEDATKTGAIHAFNEKYGDQVKVYFIGDSLASAFSKEYCGGPHVKNTSELSQIKIYKQDSVGKGARRIYAKWDS